MDESVLEAFAKGVALEEERKYAIELTQKQMLLIKDLKRKAEADRDLGNKLLLNILPEDVAEELKETGSAQPVLHKSVTVLFTDFVGFTAIAEKMTPHELVKNLDVCFGFFDQITEKHRLEKLKTIGDSYMCAGGLPKPTKAHPVDAVLAAIEMQEVMKKLKREKQEKGEPFWDLRIGIHTGPLVAGVVGEKKFAYDVWGDTVNLASRMESSGAVGEINISRSTYNYVREFFDCQSRGCLPVKNKGDVEMFFIKGVKPELLSDNEKNEFFVEKYKYFKV
jgi:class 3 adenylate cyclase